ncbi:hypothetical protein OAI37_02570 [Flavobacteriaceae bacterium]|nr:hypothetical protein [Flavobacteriaceae bacterium]
MQMQNPIKKILDRIVLYLYHTSLVHKNNQLTNNTQLINELSKEIKILKNKANLDLSINKYCKLLKTKINEIDTEKVHLKKQDVLGDNKMVLLNFADKKYSSAQNVSTQTALATNNFDKIISLSPSDFDLAFKERNAQLLLKKRGVGYWCWKPTIIKKTILQNLNEGDFLIYADSGGVFVETVIADIKKLIELDQEILPYQNTTLEKHYTKADLFHHLNCQEDKLVTDTFQRVGGLAIYKVCEKTINFLDQWINLSEIEYLIDDTPSKFSNDFNFVEHRHDQSIFSVLSKLNNLKSESYMPNYYWGQVLRPHFVEKFNKMEIDPCLLTQIPKPVLLDLFQTIQAQVDFENFTN